MQTSTMLGVALAAVLAAFLVTAAASFALGERLLREVRRRYPQHWQEMGRPTYLSLAVAGANFWRPVSASNYFSGRRYTVLDDRTIVERAEKVRSWQRAMNWAMLALVAVIVLAQLTGR